MARVIEVEIQVGDRQALSTLQDLEQAQEQLLEQLKQTEIGTEEYRRLQKQLKTVGNQVKDLELGFEALDKEQRGTAIVDSFTGVAGAVTAATGALTLLGAESEDLDEVEKRILGLIAVTSGLRDISNGLVATNKLLGSTFIELADTIKTTFTTGTLAARTFKVALASLGIGLVVAGIVALVENFDKLFPTVKSTAEQLGYTNEEFATLALNASKNTTEVNLLARAVADQNKSEKERRKALDELNKKYPNYFKDLGNDINDTEALTRQKNKLIDTLIREARVRAAQEKITEIAAENIAERVKLSEDLQKATEKTAKANRENAKALRGLSVTQKDFTVDIDATAESLEKNAKIQEKVTKTSQKRLQALNNRDKIQAKINKLNKEEEEATKKREAAEKQVNDLLKKQFKQYMDNLRAAEGFIDRTGKSFAIPGQPTRLERTGTSVISDIEQQGLFEEAERIGEVFGESAMNQFKQFFPEVFSETFKGTFVGPMPKSQYDLAKEQSEEERKAREHRESEEARIRQFEVDVLKREQGLLDDKFKNEEKLIKDELDRKKRMAKSPSFQSFEGGSVAEFMFLKSRSEQNETAKAIREAEDQAKIQRQELAAKKEAQDLNLESRIVELISIIQGTFVGPLRGEN